MKVMVGRFSGKSLIAVSILVVTIFMFFIALYFDLGLDSSNLEDLTKDLKEPDITVSKLSFKREVSGDLWEFTAETAEKKDSYMQMYSVDARLLAKDGRIWNAYAPNAEYFQEKGLLEMKKAEGDGSGDNLRLDWKAPRAIFHEPEGIWVFPEGIEVLSESIDLYGTSAETDMDGNIRIENGARAIWKISEEK